MSRLGRKFLWILAASLALSAVLLCGIFWVLPRGDGGGATGRYTIGVWDNRVAVFEQDQPFPKQVFDVYVETLPAEQQRQLKAGVIAENEARLSVLLEDYTG